MFINDLRVHVGLMNSFKLKILTILLDYVMFHVIMTPMVKTVR